MKRPSSDRRLARLVSQALYALEDPAAGFVFDDFDRRYCEAERKREADAARWFYRDKTSFETKYAEDCDKDGKEPAWVSDRGRGNAALQAAVSFDLDDDECREDDQKRSGKRSSTWKMKRTAALKRVKRNLPHALVTMKLILKNLDNRKESICTLTKSLISSRANGNSHRRSTTAISKPSFAS